MALPKHQLSFDITVDKSLLYEYHPFSKQLADTTSNPNPAISSGILDILNKYRSTPTETRTIHLEFTCEREELENAVSAFFDFKQDGETILDRDHFETLLGIVDAYIQNEYRVGYTHTPLQDDIESTRKVDDSLLEEAREMLRQLRNLLYIRDVHKGKSKVKFECMHTEKGRERDKDTENSVEIKFIPREVLDTAIASVYQDIKANSYNDYLQSLFYTLGKPLQPTFESADAAYERFRKKARKISKEVLFRGQLKSVMEPYIDFHASVEPSKTTKSVMIYDIMTAFGLMEDSLIDKHSSNQHKTDYIKGLPSDDFIELCTSDRQRN